MRKMMLAALVAFCVHAVAQGPVLPSASANQETIITAEQLQSMLDNAPISKDTGKPGSLSSQLFNAIANCAFIRLDEPDLPHVHPVSEIYVMQAGAATLETGGTMDGPFTNGGVHHQAAAKGGESGQATEPIGPDHAGTAIEGGKTRDVHAGDVILIPAGLNHHWTRITQPLVYLDIKFPNAK